MKKKQKNKSQKIFVIKFENGAEIRFQTLKQGNSVRGVDFSFFSFCSIDGEEVEDKRKEENNE